MTNTLRNRCRWVLFNLLMRLPEWIVTPERIESYFSDLTDEGR